MKEFALERSDAWDAVHRLYFPDFDERWDVALGALETHFRSGAHVLDLGCGMGRLTARIAERLDASTVLGIDQDPLLISLASSAHGSESLKFQTGNVTDRTCAQRVAKFGPYDAAVSSAFMHYFDRLQLSRIHKTYSSMIRPGGLLVTVERFSSNASTTANTGTENQPSPWQVWWNETRAAARRYGFQDSPAPTQSGVTPPPLSLEVYLELLARSGLKVISNVETSCGSRVVVSSKTI